MFNQNTSLNRGHMCSLFLKNHYGNPNFVPANVASVACINYTHWSVLNMFLIVHNLSSFNSHEVRDRDTTSIEDTFFLMGILPIFSEFWDFTEHCQLVMCSHKFTNQNQRPKQWSFANKVNALNPTGLFLISRFCWKPSSLTIILTICFHFGYSKVENDGKSKGRR